jgi:hypothetical protein
MYSCAFRSMIAAGTFPLHPSHVPTSTCRGDAGWLHQLGPQVDMMQSNTALRSARSETKQSAASQPPARRSLDHVVSRGRKRGDASIGGVRPTAHTFSALTITEHRCFLRTFFHSIWCILFFLLHFLAVCVPPFHRYMLCYARRASLRRL